MCVSQVYKLVRQINFASMDVLKDLSDHLFKRKEINLDNFTFKLFYRGAAGLCLLTSIFSAGGSYFGDPIGRVFLWN